MLRCNRGTSLVELLVATFLLLIIFTSLFNLLGVNIKVNQSISGQLAIEREAQSILNDIIDEIRTVNRILVPQASSPVRNVLAYPAMIDNDGDGLVDEDTGRDMTNDGEPGIIGIDDDNDGIIDENLAGGTIKGPNDIANDDEDNIADEEIWDGLSKLAIDSDLDGACLEDMAADINKDLAPGTVGWDDNFDSLTDYYDLNGNGGVDLGIDISNLNDDDEDGRIDEDWVDPIVFYADAVNGRQLIKRIPGTGGNLPLNGADYSEIIVTNNLKSFEVTKLVGINGKTLLKVALQLDDSQGSYVSVETAIYPKRVKPCS